MEWINKSIDKKIRGYEYSKDAIDKIIDMYTKGEMDDDLMTVFIRSIFYHGLAEEATSWLTKAMMNSGDIIDLSDIEGIKVDKHSTGGVGDKVTPILGPIVAALGAKFAKMSGRGLGFTGGTLDKLESIPGYNIHLSDEQFFNNVKDNGISVIGQTKDLVPADRKMYALRDETNYVDSLPLIASSIMSKKLATGSDTILLDVKCGNAAFMKNQKDATALAEAMIKIGKSFNKDVRVEITSMETPLGRAIGNKNEMIEAYQALQGIWADDLKTVVFSSASTIIVQAKIARNEKEAEAMVEEVISNGKALAKFKEWIISQGGDVSVLEKEDFISNKFEYQVTADKDGYMNVTSAVDLGIAAMEMGAGRKVKTDKIDHNAGIYLNKKTGESFKKGEVLIILSSNKEISEQIISKVNNSFEISDKKISKRVILNKL